MPRLIKKFIFIFLVAFLLLGASHFVFAQVQPVGQLGLEYGTATGLGTQDIRLTIARIIRVFLGLIGTVLLVLVIYGGFVYMTAGGDDKKIDLGKKIIVNSVIGLAIILSAFAIVQFIISRLVAATTGLQGGDGGGGGGGGVIGAGLPPDSFYVTGISPQGNVSLRNITLRATFSAKVNQSTVNGGTVVVRNQTRGEIVTGTYTFDSTGKVLEFKPDLDCSIGSDQKCFDANADFTINLNSGVKRTDGKSLTCFGLSAPCSGNFHTGELVDLTPPAVSITSPVADGSYCVGDQVSIYAQTTDDSGIGYLEYLGNGSFLPDEIDTPVGSTPKNYTSMRTWDSAGLVSGKHELSVRSFDIGDPFATSLPLPLYLKTNTCCNGVQDGDETGVDAGGSCGSGAGGSCSSTADCAPGLSCVSGSCVAKPAINSIDPLDGKPGTYVTIFGYGFGSPQGAGKVKFLGNIGTLDDDKEASLAICTNAWKNTSIVVAIPEGTVAGPVEVTNNGGFADSSEDLGALGIFTPNDLVRPGICQINPDNGSSGSRFDVIGNGFGGSQGDSTLSFGNRITNTSAWADTLLDEVAVPSVQEGQYIVKAKVNGVDSNGAYFNVSIPLTDKPTIAGADPVSGGIGTYITITGDNFGVLPGTVVFIRGQDVASADISFPDICLSGYWRNTTITVKVPESYRDGNAVSQLAHQIQVIRSDGARSNTTAFSINTKPPGPSLCLLSPDNGPIGTQTTAYGEKFGDTEGSITYFQDKDVGSTFWSDGSTSSLVPVGARSGPVVVSRSDSEISNNRSFRVADCKESGCGGGETCCGSSCIPEGQPCKLGPRAGALLWRISTGPIPKVPRVIEQIGCALATQSPTPYKNTQDACVNGQISVRFSELMDQSTFASLGNDIDSVKVEACGTSAIFNQDACDSIIDANLNFGEWSDPSTGVKGSTLVITGFPLATTTWYRVTFNKSLASSAGVGLDASYFWRFRTGNETCTIDKLEVTPSDATIIEQNANQRFTALPEAANCNILACDSFSWSWQSSNQTLARVSGPSVCNTVDDIATNDIEYTDAEGLEESGPEIVKITASANLGGESSSDFGNLKIDFTDPEVVEFWPNCEAACVNSEAGAVFSTRMNPATINSTNIALYKCTEESCRSFDGPAKTANIEYLEEYLGNKNVARVMPTANLLPNQFYAVRVKGGVNGVKSTSGVPLIGLNDSNLYFRWIFRTKNDATICSVDSVQVSPERAEAKIMGTRVIFSATPRGSPDECSSVGQPLNPLSYNWDWQSEKTQLGNFYPLSESSLGSAILASELVGAETTTLLNISPLNSVSYCSNQCLNLGSRSNVSECGNNKIESGEDCDDGNLVSGDGCGGQCLNEGAPASCGNNIIERSIITGVGEECDDGNTVSGDGCSVSCLFEGSRLGGSVCGNGAKGYGENCDDGNTVSGDGCSADCLNEGSEINVSVCGNSQIEPGEDCDDGNARDGADTNGNGIVELSERDGCSSRCLNQGRLACGSPGLTNCCSNNLIEAGEDCDDGNLVTGDGCSNLCLNEGSKLPYALCGNRNIGEPRERGEDCDPGIDFSRDTGIDPKQLATAIKGSPISPDNTTKIFASTENKSDSSEFKVICNCQADSDCGDALANACGVSSCCYPRPSVISVTPQDQATGICRNTLVSATFSERMNKASFLGNFIVWRALGTGESTCADGSVPILGGALGLSGAQGSSKFCPAQSSVDVIDVAGRSTATIELKEALRPNTLHLVEIKGDQNVNDSRVDGIRSLNGSPINGVYRWRFTTGSDICEISEVSTTPEEYVFGSKLNNTADDSVSSASFDTIADSDKLFVATAYAKRSGGSLEPINRIASVYDWNWSWQISNPATLSVAQLQEPLTTESVGGNSRIKGNQVAVAGSSAGQATLLSGATVITPAQATGEQPETFIGQSLINTFYCQNPWPSFAAGTTGNQFPYKDSETGISLYYCRDAGDPTKTNDDLPAPTTNSPVAISLAGLAYDPSSRWEDPYLVWAAAATPKASLLKEFLFTFNCSTTSMPCKKDDAIGIRVFSNLEHESPEDWYASQGFIGKPSNFLVGGYEAVREGRSTYVNAPNFASWPTTSGNFRLQTYTNIYVISENQAASPETSGIYNQILENIKFAYQLGVDIGICNGTRVCSNDFSKACSTNAECGSGTCGFKSCSADSECSEPPSFARRCYANNAKMSRNVKRLSDAVKIYRALDVYRKKNGTYPELASGSFLPSVTFSAWPSWQNVLGSELNMPLPEDPLNKFRRCPESFGYDKNTCWNATSLRQLCPANSYVYYYERSGTSSYFMNFPQEYLLNLNPVFSGYLGWEGQLEPPVGIDPESGPPLYVDNVRDIDRCNNQLLGATSRCGDGVVGAGEQCESGETKTVACTTSDGKAGFRVDSCSASCSFVSGVCQAGNCGDGVKQSSEACDDGNLNGQYGKCNSLCTGFGGQCGDGIINGSEFCDKGAQNGAYGSGCSWDCKSAGPRCGDKIVNGSEKCDGNTESSKGYCNGLNYAGCSKDSDCSGGLKCTNICEINRCSGLGNSCVTDADCTSSSCFKKESVHSRSCASNCVWDAGTDIGGDTFITGWSSCRQIESCGNGIKEAGEECDDGNTETNDSCVSCRVARCGDSYINKGVELCDAGSNNGKICDPAYNSSCSYCSDSCKSVVLSGPYCGDGVRYNSREACDNLDLGSQNCLSLGYAGGTASCNPTCSSVVGQCFSCFEHRPLSPHCSVSQDNICRSTADCQSGESCLTSNEGGNIMGRVVGKVCRSTTNGKYDLNMCNADTDCGTGFICVKKNAQKIKVDLMYYDANSGQEMTVAQTTTLGGGNVTVSVGLPVQCKPDSPKRYARVMDFSVISNEMGRQLCLREGADKVPGAGDTSFSGTTLLADSTTPSDKYLNGTNDIWCRQSGAFIKCSCRIYLNYEFKNIARNNCTTYRVRTPRETSVPALACPENPATLNLDPLLGHCQYYVPISTVIPGTVFSPFSASGGPAPLDVNNCRTDPNDPADFSKYTFQFGAVKNKDFYKTQDIFITAENCTGLTNTVC